MSIHLSADGARTLMCAAQGLLAPPARAAGRDDVLATIRRLGALQIDTIHVVARSPYLVLWSRLGAYEPRWLDGLLAEGALFEYWAHAACFLPIEDYSLYRRRMLEGCIAGWMDGAGYIAEHRQEAEALLARIREQGPVRSADFEREGEGGGWWQWKPEKRLLEALFNAGELMIARRERFQRVYDLRERVLPDWDDTRLPTEEEVMRALTLKAVRALGVACERWVAGYFYHLKKTGPLLARLAEDGALLDAQVDGWPAPLYVHAENAEMARAAADGTLQPALTTLLSPFDPLVSDRQRTLTAFGFDYALECYTPAAKRRYGYFCLPILHRGSLVGRLDAKAHRTAGRFEVRALHLEPGAEEDAALAPALASALAACAVWHGTPEVVFAAGQPTAMAEVLQAALALPEVQP